MKISLVWLAPLALLGMSSWTASKVSGEVHPASPPLEVDIHETHAAASLLGQFRTSAASWLWLRTDLYLHNGVEMRPLTDEEIQAGKKGVGGAKDGHEPIVNDDRLVTIVPPEAKDFRGVFGDLERAVGAYQTMEGHSHNDPAQSLPLYRLMTWFDPQFTLAWVTGATVLARDRSEKGTQKALAWLHEAEANNPRSVAIPTEKGRLILTRRNDLESALPFLEEAMRRGGDGRLPDLERDALNLAARLLALVYRDLNRPEDMSRHLERATRLFRNDEMLKRLAEDPNAGPLKEEHTHGPGCGHKH